MPVLYPIRYSIAYLERLQITKNIKKRLKIFCHVGNRLYIYIEFENKHNETFKQQIRNRNFNK